MARLQEEQEFHDQQARQRAITFAREPGRLVFADEDYLDHETWIRPAWEQLGLQPGQRALDFGCGHGMAAVVMARQGAAVTAFDLSAAYVAEARLRAAANQVRVEFVVADGEYLPFADGCFDRIWGNAVLHHLDQERVVGELNRVLAPGGRAIFCEPWGGNPLLTMARDYVPYPGKGRTREEKPLGPRDLQVYRRRFRRVGFQGFQLFSMVRRIWPGGGVVRFCEQFDSWALAQVPGLQKWSRYVVITLEK